MFEHIPKTLLIERWQRKLSIRREGHFYARKKKYIAFTILYFPEFLEIKKFIEDVNFPERKSDNETLPCLMSFART